MDGILIGIVIAAAFWLIFAMGNEAANTKPLQDPLDDLFNKGE